MSRGTRRIALVAALALAGIAAAAVAAVALPDRAHGQSSEASAPGITVTGSGSVKAAPDRADFSFGVETQGGTSAEALERNSVAVEQVIAALKGAGVASEDIQTQQVSVSPRYSDNGQKIIGYTATNTVNATVRDLSKAGAVVEAAVSGGANQVYGPTFSITDQTKLYDGALEAALANARGKAETLANAAGVSLGRIVAIVEGSSFGPPILAAEAAAATDAEVPIEPGQQEITATLTVTFSIS